MDNEKKGESNLFQLGEFKLHSGRISHFKIECDALTSEDWETLAVLIKDKFQFREVVGVPSGGLKLARVLSKYKDDNSDVTLIVDDVLTTGDSIRTLRNSIKGESIGVVIFTRGECPYWIYPLFEMWDIGE